ncbi:MAG: amidohydrolase family protein [Vicinamibacteria bacterium]
MKIHVSLRLSWALAFVPLFLAPAAAQVTAIKAGKLVEPSTATTLLNQVILVEGARIQTVGENLSIPPNATTIDLSELTVLPGLFESHTHLAGSYDPETTNLKAYNVDVSTAERAIQGVINARSMLEAGFTTVRDLGNAGNYADAALARFIGAPPVGPVRAGESGFFTRPFSWGGDGIDGPTTFISGKIIAPFGGQFRVNAEHPDVGRQDYLYADTREEMRKAIRENLHYGATWIKIVVDDYRYIYSTDDIQFMVEEAAAAGVKIAAHCVTDRGARNAIEAGVASIEHGYEMSDETLELAKRRGVVLVGTELPKSLQTLYGRGDRYAPILDRLKRAHRIGVEMAFGADILRETPGFTRGQLCLTPIDTWVDAGIPAKDILRAMTTNAARLLDVDDDRGAIRAGMAADLIETPANPLHDIQTLKRVAFVMKDGVVIRKP